MSTVKVYFNEFHRCEEYALRTEGQDVQQQGEEKSGQSVAKNDESTKKRKNRA